LERELDDARLAAATAAGRVRSPSLNRSTLPTVNGNTARSFSTHGQTSVRSERKLEHCLTLRHPIHPNFFDSALWSHGPEWRLIGYSLSCITLPQPCVPQQAKKETARCTRAGGTWRAARTGNSFQNCRFFSLFNASSAPWSRTPAATPRSPLLLTLTASGVPTQAEAASATEPNVAAQVTIRSLRSDVERLELQCIAAGQELQTAHETIRDRDVKLTAAIRCASLTCLRLSIALDAAAVHADPPSHPTASSLSPPCSLGRGMHVASNSTSNLTASTRHAPADSSCQERQAIE
jgi:hypothetical protein